MSNWQPMDTAPMDRVIEAKMKRGKIGLVSRTLVEDQRGRQVGAWMWETDGWPDSWCDGVCWHRNSYNERSEQPIAWRDPEQQQGEPND